MSVYKPQKSRIWQYDFQLNGRRFHGSTGQASRRAAEAVERQRRLEAATGQLGAIANMPLDLAAGRWWKEKGIHRGDAADVERRLEKLIAIIGPDRRLGDINQAVVAEAIETRSGQTYVKSGRKDARRYAVSRSTVNRDIVETFRPIHKRARSHWTAQGDHHGLPDIDWRELRLTEPRPQSRLYSPAERAAWGEAMQDDLRLALELILTYGLRLGELFFQPELFKPDPSAPILDLQKGRKRDVILHLPVRQDHGRELAARQARAMAADPPLPHLWFHEVPSETEGEPPTLVAYTYAQVEARLTKAADSAGITGARRIHGGRHHAGSTMLKRSGGNLKAVQGLLGHASISSSQRYAHVLIDDMRALLEDEKPAAAEAVAERRVGEG